MKNQIMSCEFNVDTACVEVKLTDGSMVLIDCDAVEDEYARNIYEVSELYCLIVPNVFIHFLISFLLHPLEKV
ncbi:MAG: hypothetical protein IJ395_01180 [Clostridia bacterium]|nr:hypothetical protein [Clostridia bacterium]